MSFVRGVSAAFELLEIDFEARGETQLDVREFTADRAGCLEIRGVVGLHDDEMVLRPQERPSR